MGNKDSSTSARPEAIQNLSQVHLGAVTLMRSEQDYCILKILSFTDSFLMEERLRRFKARAGKIGSNAHVLEVYSVSRVERKQLCASNYQLHVFLEQPTCTLAAVIAARLQEKRNFSEGELFAFLAKVVDSLIYIQDNGLKNIQVDSHAILYCAHNLKVLDSAIALNKTYFHLLEQREKGTECPTTDIYLAPELLKELKELNYDPYVSPKADIFSLGMILLEMVTLEPMQGYYDYPRAAIDYESLIHRLSRINHSLPLKTLIAEMLEYDPEERIGLLSLKEKVQRLANPQSQYSHITRSKSSKMLKEILSQSRKSGSLSRQGEPSSTLSRQPSTERKSLSRIDLHCNSGKKGEKEKGGKGEKGEKGEKGGKRQGAEESIGQAQFKNLVKSKLREGRNKENKLSSAGGKPFKPVKQEHSQARMLHQHNSNRGQPQSRKLESCSSSKFLEASLGCNQASLCKLVEESGLKKLLKQQQLNESTLKRSQPESLKNTSRFGNHEGTEGQDKMSRPQALRKISEIYIREEDASEGDPMITVREPVCHDRQLQKVMTFNSKEFLLSARSVEPSVDDTSPHSRRQEKLAFSPINQQAHESSQESPATKMTIKDVPVVISQEKVYEPAAFPQNIGKLQRNLHLLDCAQSIEQDTPSKDSNFASSKVIQAFKPHRREHYTPVGINASNVESYSRDNSCFLKKGKGRKPELNIQVHEDEEEEVLPPQGKNESNNQTPYQKLPSVSSKLAKLEYLYRTSQSIEQLSNFTSISPPQDSKDSNSTFQLILEGRSSKREEGGGNPMLRKVVLPNGDSYQGELSPQGLPHGNGILERAGEFQYSGSFKEGSFNGYGTLLNLKVCPSPVDHRHIDLSKGNWVRFEGEFEEGRKSGFGTIYFEGEKFSGCLRKDVVEGYGCFYKKSGELVSGLWRESRFRKI